MLPALLAALALGVSLPCADAGASPSIQGVWSFSGGQIGIQALPNGTLEGTVVVATKFDECVHEVGQPIWTDITPQADGSYWGLHQWYFQNTNCQKNPERGPTAWRVIRESSGADYLEVCLSPPGGSQPTIAPDGSGVGAGYGCIKSSLTSGLPMVPGDGPGGSTPTTGVAGEVERLSLPSARRCTSLRRFAIHLREPRYDPFKTVLVRLLGHRVLTSKKGGYALATIDLRGLRRGAFKITISVTTTLGHHLSSSRTYHTCRQKPLGRSKAPVRH